MKKLALVILVSFVTISNYAQTKNFIDQSYIDTTAKVDSLVSPDRIYLNIILHEEDSKGKISIEVLEKKLEKVLKKNGVNTAKDLAVLDMTSNYKKYFLKEKDILKSKAFSLLLYDAKNVGNIFVDLEEIGISNVSLEKTDYSNMDELEMKMKTKAVLKAKKQALALTEPLGQKVGKAIYIMDRNQRFNNYRSELDDVVMMSYSDNEAPENKSIEVEFQKIKIETTVSVKFKLE